MFVPAQRGQLLRMVRGEPYVSQSYFCSSLILFCSPVKPSIFGSILPPHKVSIACISTSQYCKLQMEPWCLWNMATVCLYSCHLQLLSCPHCRSVKIWSFSQCLCTAILVHGAAVVALQLSALLIVSACRDGAVCLWNLHNPHCPLMQWKTTDGVYFSALSISGSHVFGAGRSEYSPPSPCLLPTFVI